MGKVKQVIIVLLLTMPLSGCFLETMAVLSTAMSGTGLYYTYNRDTAEVNIEKCTAWKEIKVKTDEWDTLSDGLQVQLINNNKNNKCICKGIEEWCSE